MKKIFVVPAVFVMLALALLASPATAQENGGVCLVYFTSHECGDDCGLTDVFMDGLLNEYTENLTSIKYHTDVSQESRDVFEAYRTAYNLPQDVPIVLFGKDDYLQGRDDIYENTEMKILGYMRMNGTNCPLEVGYVPPGRLTPSSMPGQPDVRQGGPANASQGDGNGQKPQANVSGGNGETPFPFVLLGEAETESVISLVIILAAMVAIGIFIFFLWVRAEEIKAE